MATMPSTMTVGFMRAQPLEYSIKDRFSQIFTVALLLSGGVRQAEAAMLDAIRGRDPEQVPERAFLLDCVRASMDPRRQAEAQEDMDKAAFLLPSELGRIVRLAPRLRHGFVLRMLLGLSREECARLNVADADLSAGCAAQQLAQAA